MAFLKKQAKFVGEKHQVDEYFSPSHRNFPDSRPVNEWLRLRNSGTHGSITYKNWYHDKKGKSLSYCDEYQTQVKDIRQMKKILKVLNFKSLVIVDKARKVWRYRDYEVSLDKVKGLGDFIEIEYMGKSKNKKPTDIIKEMIEFLKTHDCGKIEKNDVGYPFMLLFPEEVKHEEV